MPDYKDYYYVPWYSYKIQKVVIENGVTRIGKNAFCYLSLINSVTIPNSVTSIGEFAFGDCSGLTSITIPESVTSIGDYAFSGCSGLTSFTIPNSVTGIGRGAFYGCSGLTSITIPNSVMSIGDYAFYGCSGLTSITIPNSVKSIGSSTFSGCKGLNSIFVEKENKKYDSRNNCNAIIEKKTNTLITGCKNTIIPSTVTSVGNHAFSGCSDLTSISIPNSVTSIGDGAFWDCSGLTSFTIPNSVTSIENHAFYKCSGLTSITIPNSVTSIGESAFSGCTGLTSVTIPNSVTSIGGFSGCTGLTSVTIPNSVTSIGDYAFSGCTGLTSITIPNSVTSIGGDAFSGCTGLTSVTIPNSVTSVGNHAFSGCSNLTSLTIPNSVMTIENNAFNGCSGLSSIIIPNSVTSIGGSAFRGCSSLASITIPNSVKYIGSSAFYGSGLTSIICEATTPPDCDKESFKGVNMSIPVYVPANSIDEYEDATAWFYFSNIQAIPDMRTLTDGTSYTNNSQFNGRDISYTRTFNNTKWQALYIPFSMSYNDWKNDFEIAYINGVRQLDKDDNGTIDETIMDVIKIKSGSTSPNMPYLIKAKTTGKKTFSVSNATLYPAEENSVDCSTTIAKYTFTGTYNAVPSATMIANSYYAMGGGGLIQSDGSNDLKPYRWYMKVESRNPSYNASNAAKTITINVIDDEEEMTTSIRQLQITNDELSVYDLNGRQVNENNLKPGIYVKNGKKFVVK